MNANSSEARIAIEAPKLAMTSEMAAVLPRRREKSAKSSASASAPVSPIAAKEAAITAQLIDNCPID